MYLTCDVLVDHTTAIHHECFGRTCQAQTQPIFPIKILHRAYKRVFIFVPWACSVIKKGCSTLHVGHHDPHTFNKNGILGRLSLLIMRFGSDSKGKRNAGKGLFMLVDTTMSVGRPKRLKNISISKAKMINGVKNIIVRFWVRFMASFPLFGYRFGRIYHLHFCWFLPISV